MMPGDMVATRVTKAARRPGTGNLVPGGIRTLTTCLVLSSNPAPERQGVRAAVVLVPGSMRPLEITATPLTCWTTLTLQP
jgi:hypothetical protein